MAEEMKTAAENTKKESEAKAQLTKATREQKAAVEEMKDSLKKFGNELFKVSQAGIDLGKSLGTTATQGVQLELQNRKSVALQMMSLDVNSMVTMKEQATAQQALTDTFIGTAAGMQISAEGTTALISSLKTGAKSDFELTAQSMRALTVAGVGTGAQMEEFRKASGRSSLSSEQFSKIVNNNSLSFLVYGKSFAKAAADADRLGISLSQVQGAQQSMVTNLDGTIDTIAQLNQLGGNVDFGTLVQKLEMEGPDAVLKYLSSAIPGDLMQSTSFRALVGQLGIPAETILKQQKVGGTADVIEKQMTEAAKATGDTAKGLTVLGRVMEMFDSTMKGVVLSAWALGGSFVQLFVTTRAIRAAQALQGGVGGGAGAAAAVGGSIASNTGGAAGGNALGGTSKGVSSFSGNSILKGAAAMLIVAASVYVLGKALQEFSTVKGEDMIRAGAALGVLAAGAFVLSAGAPAILTGATVIAALGASLIPFGVALRIMAPTLPVLSTFIGSLGELKLGTAAALAALGPALSIFAGGLTAAALASLVGGGIVNKITTLSAAAPGIAALAGAIRTLKTSLDELNAVDVSKLNEIRTSTNRVGTASVIASRPTTVSPVSTPPVVAQSPVRNTVEIPNVMRMGLNVAAQQVSAANSSVSPTPAGQTNLGLERKMEELITTIRSANTTINIDGTQRTVPRMQVVKVLTRNEAQ